MESKDVWIVYHDVNYEFDQILGVFSGYDDAVEWAESLTRGHGFLRRDHYDSEKNTSATVFTDNYSTYTVERWAVE